MSMTGSSAELGTVDLTNCDREPIHVPGAVQPHGALLVLDPGTLVIRQAGGSTRGLLAEPPETLPGRRLDDLLDAEQIASLREAAAVTDGHPVHLLGLRGGRAAVPLSATLHRTEAGLVVELEPAGPPQLLINDPLAAVQVMLARVSSASSVAEFCQRATEEVRRVTGYDRVMVYRFLADETGEVIAEDAAPGVASFLGLHYPGSDIPRQARALYVTNRLRVIVDVDYAPAPLIPASSPVTGQPLDMSRATLRAVSPLHLEYLRNMQVAASMTISIVRDARLWGLIACHHRTPKPLPKHLRAVCELFGEMFSLQLDAREHQVALAARHRHARIHGDLVAAMARADDLAGGLIAARPSLVDYVEANGVAVLIDGQFAASGRVPPEGEVRALAAWLDGNAPDGLYATDSLSAHYEPARRFATEASGLLAVSASRTPSDYILWFRPELVETVRWGGDPRKAVEVAADGERLTPRKSFTEWREAVRLRARPWNETDLEAARTLRLSLLDVILRRLDQVARERERAERRHRVMLAELNHRVKNTLATIQSMALLSRQGARSLDEYVRAFEQRIRAMAASHNLLSEASWGTVPLRHIVDAHLRPYAREGHVEVQGPDVELDAAAASALGMVLHELATNAAKHGALLGDGRVAVGWRIEDAAGAPVLKLSWRERGGPPVGQPTHRGFGTFTLERLIGFQVAGRTNLRFAAEGFECDIELGEGVRAATPNAVEVQPGQPPRILVAEDEMMVAFVVEDVVKALGWEVVGPVARVEAAAELAGDPGCRLDGAVLDINLAGDKVWPVADALAARGVPFFFASGYDRSQIVPERFASAIVLGKPFGAAELTARIQALVPGMTNPPPD
jgi:light-regulated signal transduction histidine kinase (bacteriophytochrome)/CheY-like chemotaxis protein